MVRCPSFGSFLLMFRTLDGRNNVFLTFVSSGIRKRYGRLDILEFVLIAKLLAVFRMSSFRGVLIRKGAIFILLFFMNELVEI